MESFFIIDNQGKKRPAKKIICDSCGSEFLKSTRFLNKCKNNYCSRICASKGRDKKVTQVCSYCNKNFQRRASSPSKSGLYFCTRKCKDVGQQIISNIKAIQPSHYGIGQGQYTYRYTALQHYPKECEVCKYDKRTRLLQVHHIDSKRTNNKLENLVVLCPTCHWAITLGEAVMGKDRIFKWVPQTLTFVFSYAILKTMAKKTAQLPVKIVNHIAYDAIAAIRKAIGEADGLARLSVFSDRNSHPGIDLAVLQEKLKETDKLVELLCVEDWKHDK